MDALKRCQEKLSHFRLRDLQELLGQLGMAKQGKKQDLMDKILDLLDLNQDIKILNREGQLVQLGPEGIEKLIDNISSNISDKKMKTEMMSEPKPDFKSLVHRNDGFRVRCLCGSSLFLEPMIQCEDKKCRIWQHAGCVIVPDPVHQTFQIPSPFFCEICRINHSDPFWVTIAYPLIPTKLVPNHMLLVSDGVSTKECMERWIQLSNHHVQLLRRTEYELQVWIMLLNDEVQFRMHWPLAAEFHVNGVPMQVLSRPGSQLLGINSRDAAALIKKFCKEGMNKITLSWQDIRTFCLGIRIAKRRTIHQVVSMVPKGGEGESFEEALARVCRCIGGGNYAIKNEENNSDNDLELISDRVTIDLRCPIGGKRMKIAARFKPCSHMACFDLITFIQINSHACKWQCPICLKNYCLNNLIIDPYFARITSILEKCDEDLTEIEVKKDGMWRIKTNISNSPWHSFEDSISNMNPVHRPELNYQNAPLLLPNSHFGENPISPILDSFEIGSNPQFPQFFSDYSENFTNPNLHLFGDWNPNFGQNEWIPLSAGISQTVPVSVTEASSSIQNFCSISNLGQSQNPGCAIPDLNPISNQQSFPNAETLMIYDNFSHSMNSELNHNTIDPNLNFQFFSRP